MASMFDKGKIEGIKSEGAETIVGTSVKLKGNLKSDGDIIIDGIVSGELKTKGSVIIGPNASVVASIRAKDVTVSGAVQGNIEATDRLELTETGRVIGDISANVLSISAGAIFTGNSKMNDTHKEIAHEPVMEDDQEVEKSEEK
jgi:cytoskeletal protein CcmA (bactofilin family)